MCSSSGTNRVLDIVRSGGYVNNGGNVQIYNPTDTLAQHWFFIGVGNNQFRIIPRTNMALALTAYPSSANGTSSGTGTSSPGNIFVSTYTASAYQKWKFIDQPIESRAPNPDAQNKDQWCWIAASKKTAFNNRQDISSSFPSSAQLVDTNGLHSFGSNLYYGVDSYGHILADGVQRATCVSIKDNDVNEYGLDTEVAAALDFLCEDDDDYLNNYVSWNQYVTPNEVLYVLDNCLTNNENTSYFVLIKLTPYDEYNHTFSYNPNICSHDVVFIRKYEQVIGNNAYTFYEYWDPWNNATESVLLSDLQSHSIYLPYNNDTRYGASAAFYCIPESLMNTLLPEIA